MSTYCVRSDIEDQFGVSNLSDWAILADGYSAEQITARITRGIAWAGARIDTYLRKGGYAIPVMDEDGSTPTEITHAAAALAGWWVYCSRGVDDVDRNGSPRNKLQFHYDDVMRFMGDIRAGNVRINAREHTG